MFWTSFQTVKIEVFFKNSSNTWTIYQLIDDKIKRKINDRYTEFVENIISPKSVINVTAVVQYTAAAQNFGGVEAYCIL